MVKNLIKLVILTLLVCPYLLNGQSDNIFFLSRDTLTINHQYIIRSMYRCDEKYFYGTNDTVSQIIEIYYGNGLLRERKFYRTPGEINSFISIEHECNGNIEFGTMHFIETYKDELYSFDTFIYNGVAASLYIQTLSGKILAEYRCHKGKWHKAPYHNSHPIKCAKKLINIYLSLYEQRLYQIENCIWF